ncbi:hypothetical protein ACFYYR_25335 [Streptomyces sp. NPDC001922]|uniref:hypothetical protein n=1 Tax=Streptomyces sp. NPDC001922 TaxID=3364624 RepID=UPI0036C7872B
MTTRVRRARRADALTAAIPWPPAAYEALRRLAPLAALTGALPRSASSRAAPSRIVRRLERRRQWSGTSDSTVGQYIRRGHPGALTVLVERHYPAVHSYLRTCLTEPGPVEWATEETFRRAYQATERGTDVFMVWRIQLLATARTVAMRVWAQDTLSPGITTEFRQWAASGGTWPIEARVALSDAYTHLPMRWQTALWHSVIECDDPAVLGKVLGVPKEKVPLFSDRARGALRDSYLAAYRRKVENRLPCLVYAQGRSLHPVGASEHWSDSHQAQCTFCGQVESDLSDLDHQLRAQLPEKLLGWWNDTAYREMRRSSHPSVDKALSLARRIRSGECRRTVGRHL